MDLNIFFVLAAGLSVINFSLHVFIGGPQIADPMRSCRTLDPMVRAVNFYCWHLVSISLAQFVILFGWASMSASALPLAVVGTGTAAAFCLWGLVLGAKAPQKYKDVPQGFLFLPVAVLGLIGLLS